MPILRAGSGRSEPAVMLIPDVWAGFVGAKRNEETCSPSVYHKSLPTDLGHCQVTRPDPMPAMRGSTVAAIALLKERRAKRLSWLHLIAAPVGVRGLRVQRWDVHIFTAAFDRRLNRKGCIVPGPGGAGARLFGV